MEIVGLLMVPYGNISIYPSKEFSYGINSRTLYGEFFMETKVDLSMESFPIKIEVDLPM